MSVLFFFFFSVWLLAFLNCWLASYVIPLLTLFCVKQKYIFMLHGDNSYQYFAFNSNHNLWPTWFCKKNDIYAVRKGLTSHHCKCFRVWEQTLFFVLLKVNRELCWRGHFKFPEKHFMLFESKVSQTYWRD